MASSGLTGGEKSFGVESEDPDRGSNPRRNGRRRSKGSTSEATSQKKKKIPQRGMGVAELERLRMQEEPQASPTHNTTLYFHNPFAPAPVKSPLSNINSFGSGNNYGFSRQTGCNPNGFVPWHSKDHHHQLPSIRDSVCIHDLCGFCVKKKRTNDMDFCRNKSMKDDVGSMNNIIKERVEERSGDVVMHQFFPIGKKDKVKVRLELGLEASPAAAAAAAGGGDDDDVVVFKKMNSIDLSLRL